MAAVSLARMLPRQRRHEEARQTLHDTYDWFAEGFDTPDPTCAPILLTAA